MHWDWPQSQGLPIHRRRRTKNTPQGGRAQLCKAPAHEFHNELSNFNVVGVPAIFPVRPAGVREHPVKCLPRGLVGKGCPHGIAFVVTELLPRQIICKRQAAMCDPERLAALTEVLLPGRVRYASGDHSPLPSQLTARALQGPPIHNSASS